MGIRINESIKDLKPYVAGLTKEEVARKHGLNPSEVIKLASNENPFGPSPKAVEAIQRYADQVFLYPEDYPRDLISAISGYVGLPEDMIIPGGNGADEILDIVVKLLVSRGDEVITHPPTFPYYGLLARLYGGKVVEVPMKNDYSFPANEISDRVGKKTRLVIICSPNNPTGGIISETDIKSILDTGVLVLLDEAYVEFAQRSLTLLVKKHENLVVLRTFSKAFGLAGLRVGYGISQGDFIADAFKIKPPHNVNLLAQKAATASLADLAHLKKAVEAIRRQREIMAKELSKVPGVTAHPSQANFILLDLQEKKGEEVILGLERKGIIVRGCGAFGLENCIRVSVGREDENRAFLKAFKEELK